jgi:large subunit ribosomal protein L18
LTTSHYIHIFRRRREGKTDYRKRKGMIIGKQPFLSIRISGRYIYAQILRPTAKGDITLCASSSRDLTKFGWKGASKNLPGAFLTGFQLGQLAKNSNVKSAILYSSVGRFVHGSRIASVVNGAKQAGLEISVEEDSLPDEGRTQGKHIAAYAKKLGSEDQEKYNRIFSKIISGGTTPESYPTDFEKVKMAIQKGVSG